MPLDSSHHNVDIKSDSLFLAESGLPLAKLDPPRIGLDVLFGNTTKPCAWVRNPQFWSYAHTVFLGKGHPPTIWRSNPRFWSPNSAQPEIWQEKRNHASMISIFWKISKSGATAVCAHSPTFYAPARLFPCN